MFLKSLPLGFMVIGGRSSDRNYDLVELRKAANENALQETIRPPG